MFYSSSPLRGRRRAPMSLSSWLTGDDANRRRLPNNTIAAGIVVTAPIPASVRPTARRAEALSFSPRSNATPAPSAARVAMMNPSSGMVRVLVCMTRSLQKGRPELLGYRSARGPCRGVALLPLDELTVDRILADRHPIGRRVLREDLHLRIDEVRVLQHLEPRFGPRVAERRGDKQRVRPAARRQTVRPPRRTDPP